ncbi:MAG: class I SAM-dependent methyltransferase [Planctomycetota bacterium]|jgi:hypothetical protein|nr:class I SAM-dependent methyltransferase [Planctomycetota bacterium]
MQIADNAEEIVARWEWFRRPVWGRAEYALLNPLFRQLLAGRASCLYSGGALGRSALDLAQNVNCATLAHLPSAYGVERGRELAKSRNLQCGFIAGERAAIAANLPHPVDCIVSPNWMLEPDWQTLKANFSAAFQALNPGGVLAFPSPQRDRNWQPLLKMFDGWDEDAVVWHCRDGAQACVCLRSKAARENDFADVKYRYLATKGDAAQIDVVVRRLPAYWAWSNVVELAKQAGFQEIDSRDFPAGAAESDFSALAIIRKPGGAAPSANNDGRLFAYADF